MKTYEKITLTSFDDVTEQEVVSQTIKATVGEQTFWIPLDPANSDYAEYLRLQDWLAEGKDEADFWNQSEVI